jgi:hypothetical protein
MWIGTRAVEHVETTPVGSLPQWSSADGLSVGVEAGWWEELGVVVVRVDSDVPGGGVDQGVVVAAEQDQVGQGGGAAVGPVVDVVGVAGDRWAGAAREGAVSVAGEQCVPEAVGDQSGRAAGVEDL